MKPGDIIKLPKADKRYKVGTIKKDKHGRDRGNPETVSPKTMDMTGLPIEMQMNPPIVISSELSEYLDTKAQT